MQVGCPIERGSARQYLDRAFGPLRHDAPCSWAVGPGWYEAGLWPFVCDGASTLFNAGDDERAGATYNKTAFDSA
jgi:hypothetical protein